MANEEHNADADLAGIISKLKDKARQASQKYMVQTPIVILAFALPGQTAAIPPQRRQYLDLGYIQKVAPELCNMQSVSLVPLAKMLNSSNSFERETVGEILGYQPEAYGKTGRCKWVLSPEFCTALARQIDQESDSVLQMDLWRICTLSKVRSPSVLISTNKWVEENYGLSDYSATSGISTLACLIADADTGWAKDTEQCLQTLSKLSKNSDFNIRYRVYYGIESAFKLHRNTPQLEKLIALVKNGVTDEDDSVSKTAIDAFAALGQNNKPYFDEILLPLLRGNANRDSLKLQAICAAGSIGPPAANPALPYIIECVQKGPELLKGSSNYKSASDDLYQYRNPLVKVGIAIGAIKSFGAAAKSALPALKELSHSSDRYISQTAIEAINNIGPGDL